MDGWRTGSPGGEASAVITSSKDRLRQSPCHYVINQPGRKAGVSPVLGTGWLKKQLRIIQEGTCPSLACCVIHKHPQQLSEANDYMTCSVHFHSKDGTALTPCNNTGKVLAPIASCEIEAANHLIQARTSKRLF